MMSPASAGEWLGTHWGEAAAFALVGLAAAHLIRRTFFKKKSDASCCKSGCSALPPANGSKPASRPSTKK